MQMEACCRVSNVAPIHQLEAGSQTKAKEKAKAKTLQYEERCGCLNAAQDENAAKMQ